jgi:hypothetical protein
MRVIGQSLAALVGAFLVVSLVGGQQPGGGFGKGGFGGGFGGAALQQDPVALLRLDQVKKELNVTDEQSEKIPEAVMKGLSGVLNDKQMTRLRQIELQLKKNSAYLDAHVQKELKITAEQKTSIKTILDDSAKERTDILAAGGAGAGGKGGKGGKGAGGGFGGGANAEKLAAIDKEAADKVDLVLTADQRRAFKSMIGDEFKLEQKGFGGAGGGKGKGKKGAGAE